MSGQETIGSAERSCNKEAMLDQFNTISDGTYRDILFSNFTKERVMGEMDEFLANDMMVRCGGGSGITRLIRSMKQENLM